MDALDYFEIQHLIYRYADLLDRGRVDEASALFEYAEFYIEGLPDPISRAGENRMAQVFQQWISFFPTCDGRPNTRHATSNLIIEQDSSDRARSQSYVVVLQSGSATTIQSAMGATYCDRFEKVDGHWRFSERRLSPFDSN
jgi:hypothetical protein